MFQSMCVLNPGFRFDDVDLIINRNSLHNLLRFVGGVVKQTFRLDLAMMRNTLIVTPTWNKVSERVLDEANHGRDFETLFLQRRLPDGGTYHRVIRYSLGPLNIAVLSELDGALPASGEAVVSDKEGWHYHPEPKSVLSSEISDESQPDTRAEEVLFGPRDQTAPKGPMLNHQPYSEVIPRGTGTLSKDAAELSASASAATGIRKMPQLWLGRVPFLVRGRYSEGAFTNVNVLHLATSFAAFEKRIQDRLQKLVSLIGTLREHAKNGPGQKCIAICDKTVKPRELRIFQHHKVPPLAIPAGIRRHFWASKGEWQRDPR